MAELHHLTLADTCRRIKSGELSSREVTEHLLARISSLQDTLHPYVLVMGDAALERASELDAQRSAGGSLGALHGVPIAIKDLLYTEGVPTASGTTVMRDFQPTEDARPAPIMSKTDLI